MSNYFSNFPKVEYDIGVPRIGNFNKVVDILRRFIIHPKLRDGSAIYYEYDIQDGDRPDIIAEKYYGDSDLDWVVLLTNNLLDANYDWPLSYENFRKFIVDKYGSIPVAHQTVHHYELISQAESTNTLGKFIPEIVYEIDLTTYAVTAANERKSISSYDYEKNFNESKRQIKILDKKYMGEILSQAESIFS